MIQYANSEILLVGNGKTSNSVNFSVFELAVAS